MGMRPLCDRRVIRSIALTIAIVSIPTLAWGSSGGKGAEDLRGRAHQIFGPLPKAMVSGKNPITPEKINLGKMLFYETRISADGTVSCARCHPFGLYAADGLKTSVGNQCKINMKNSPTLLNAAAQISAHWIGNRADVEDQARQSVTGPASFGMPSAAAVEKKLKEIGYGPLFKAAFPGNDDPVTVDNFARAVGAFERTLVTPAPFDAFLKGNGAAMTPREQNGLKRFMETGCSNCHAGAWVGGGIYRKFGVLEPYANQTGDEKPDTGRFAVTGDESDRFVFKVPVLRNAEKTAPYFHDGSVETLDKAVWIMGKIQLGEDISKEKLGDIHAFIHALTGKIPEDALRIPLLP